MATPCFSCRKAVDWHVKDPPSQTAKVKQQLDIFLSSLGGGIGLSPDPPNIAYFCGACWATRMGFTEEQVTSGAAPPAQTLATDDGIKCKGVSFATTHKAYLLDSGGFDQGRVAFIYCHELMHWYSHLHLGYQNSPGKGYMGVNWDEMTADYVSANVFPKLRSESYGDLTFYNNDFVKFPELMSEGFAKCANLTGWNAKKWNAAIGKVGDLGCDESDALLEALVGKDAKAVAKIWLKWFFTSADKLKPFLECFEPLKAMILNNDVATKTLENETEYQASCAMGLTRPTW